MKSYRSIRSLTSAAFWAAALVPIALKAADSRVQAQAVVLDRAEFPCANCLFGENHYYYCFAVGPQVLVGYQTARVVNWKDDSKNYLTPFYPPWVEWSPPAPTLSISYDDKHIWVSRPERAATRSTFWAPLRGIRGLFGSVSKPVRLKRSSARDVFLNSDRCRPSGTPSFP